MIRAEPDWSSLPGSVPPRIPELLHRCLQKEAKQRLRDIGDARIIIEEALSGSVASDAVPAGVPTRSFSAPWSGVGLGRGGTGSRGSWGLWSSRRMYIPIYGGARLAASHSGFPLPTVNPPRQKVSR